MDTPQDFLARINEVCTALSPYQDILTLHDFSQLKAKAVNLKEALAREEEENRVLRIGIIGSVKAGKSTFLNALLFRGKSVLPKAATPMTASLTCLRYAEEPFAKFVFYTQEDWDAIESEANEADRRIDEEYRKREKKQKDREKDTYAVLQPITITKENVERSMDLPPMMKACLELTRTAKSSGLDLNKYLGEEETISITDIDKIKESLEQYIGSKGTLTPVVKYVILGLNNEDLRDLEVVDTPGLNDPVQSRTQETYKFMDQCDAVFLLSRASQFLSEEDLNICKKTLVGCGIRHKVIVATQMDLSAQNEAGNIPSYREAFRRSLKNIKKSASSIELTDPLWVSAFMYNYAYKIENGIPFDDEERNVKNLLKRFQTDIPVTAHDFKIFSNMNCIYKQIEKWRNEKDAIICDHQRERMNESHKDILSILNNLKVSLDKDKKLLKENDIETLRKKMVQIREAIDSVRVQISELFLEMEKEIKQKLADLRNRVLVNSKEFEELHVEKQTNTKKSSWWPIIFGIPIVTTTTTTTSYKAELSEAFSKLKDFAGHCEKDINNTFKELLDKEDIKRNITKTILSVLRNKDISFDENIILLPVSNLIDTITIPKFSFNNDSYNNVLKEQFPNVEIENEDVKKLKNTFQLLIQEQIKDIRKDIEQKTEEISKDLFRQSGEFSENLIHSLDEQMARLSEQMSHRKESLLRYDEAKKSLEQCYNNIAGGTYV